MPRRRATLERYPGAARGRSAYTTPICMGDDLPWSYLPWSFPGATLEPRGTCVCMFLGGDLPKSGLPTLGRKGLPWSRKRPTLQPKRRPGAPNAPSRAAHPGPGHRIIDTEGALPASPCKWRKRPLVFFLSFSIFQLFPGSLAFSPYKTPTLELISRECLPWSEMPTCFHARRLPWSYPGAKCLYSRVSSCKAPTLDLPWSHTPVCPRAYPAAAYPGAYVPTLDLPWSRNARPAAAPG
jgi:hypothetical protein